MKHYDAIIIGSGGGAKIAQALAGLGRRVALIEKDKAGGTCLNRGCIPSKMLIHPAGLAARLRNLHRMKIDAETKSVDFEGLVASINAYTDGLSGAIVSRFEKVEGVDYFGGAARFTGERIISVGEHTLTSDTVVIATGSRPLVPAIPGLADTPYMTSTEALRRRNLPRRLAVIGGGYIAAELGGAYAGFGSEVTFLLRSTFLRREDPEIVDEFKKAFYPGKTIHEHCDVHRVHHRNQTFFIEVSTPDSGVLIVEADALLVATGIVPNSDDLGLEQAGIALRSDGFIATDEYLQTSVPGVFALGDAAGRYLYRHAVNFEAEYWVEARFLADLPFPITYPPMPGAVFTHPEIASVGYTEQQAIDDGIDVVIGMAPYTSCAMAVARGLDHGLVKLIFDRGRGGVLVGAHLVGEEASTMIQELVLAITAGMTAREIYRQIYIHPAFPEVVRNAVRNAIKQLDPARSVLF